MELGINWTTVTILKRVMNKLLALIEETFDKPAVWKDWDYDESKREDS